MPFQTFGDKAVDYQKNELIYSNSSTFPERNLYVSERKSMRGTEFVNLELIPFIYNPTQNQLTIIEEVEIIISETGQVNEPISQDFPNSKVFERMINAIVINPSTNETRNEDYQRPSILYICGGSTETNSYFQQLVKWRRKQGYVVYTASTSETGGSNTTAIKNYIQGSMNWDTPPEFVTLVGDDGGNYNIDTYTEYDSGADLIYFVVDGTVAADVPTTAGDGRLRYNKQPVDNARGDFEDAAGAGRPNAESTPADALAIPSIDVKMKSEAIVAKTRKLKAQWTPEFAQDLNAYQALDAEAELTSIMSEYISLEIDLEILDMLISDASAADEYWNASNNLALNSAKTGYDNLGFYNTQGQWFQTLGTKLQKVSNKIHQKTLRGGANFMIISPSVATIIESIPGFASSADGDASKGKFAFGIQKMGQMNSRYEVYKNPYMTENVILMGYRGSQFLETGAVFAPYIPLIMTPLVYDPDTFTPRKGLLTRYAKKMIRPEFYGRVFVNDLASV